MRKTKEGFNPNSISNDIPNEKLENIIDEQDFETVSYKKKQKEQKNKKQQVQEQPIQEQSVQEQPIQEQPVQEQSVQEQSVQEQPVQEQPVQEQPVQEQSVQEQPVQEQPIKPKKGWNIPNKKTECINETIKIEELKIIEFDEKKLNLVKGFLNYIKNTNFEWLINSLKELINKLNDNINNFDEELLDIIFEQNEIPDFIMVFLNESPRMAFIAICKKLYEVIEENNKKYISQVLKSLDIFIPKLISNVIELKDPAYILTSTLGTITPISIIDTYSNSVTYSTNNIIKNHPLLGDIEIHDDKNGDSYYITKDGNKGKIYDYEDKKFFQTGKFEWTALDGEKWIEDSSYAERVGTSSSSSSCLMQQPIREQQFIKKQPIIKSEEYKQSIIKVNDIEIILFHNFIDYKQIDNSLIEINNIKYRVDKLQIQNFRDFQTKLNDMYNSSKDIPRGNRLNQPPFVQILYGNGELNNKIVGLFNYNAKFEKKINKNFDKLNKLEQIIITKKNNICYNKGLHYLEIDKKKYATYYLPKQFIESAKEKNPGFHFLLETNKIYYIGISFTKLDLKLELTPNEFY